MFKSLLLLSTHSISVTSTATEQEKLQQSAFPENTAASADVKIKLYLTIYVCMYCSYLSSIHEKANCIAIFWTGRPHSLGCCHFRGVWATCLPHKGGGVPLSALPKDTTSELTGLFSTISHKCRAPSREAVDTIF